MCVECSLQRSSGETPQEATTQAQLCSLGIKRTLHHHGEASALAGVGVSGVFFCGGYLLFTPLGGGL